MRNVNLPPCPNHKEGTCERSDVFVFKETDDAFVIACRTCKSVNVWPKDLAERNGRYQAFLKQQAQQSSEQKIRGLAPLYSIPSLRPGEKSR